MQEPAGDAAYAWAAATSAQDSLHSLRREIEAEKARYGVLAAKMEELVEAINLMADLLEDHGIEIPADKKVD